MRREGWARAAAWALTSSTALSRWVADLRTPSTCGAGGHGGHGGRSRFAGGAVAHEPSPQRIPPQGGRTSATNTQAAASRGLVRSAPPARWGRRWCGGARWRAWSVYRATVTSSSCVSLLFSSLSLTARCSAAARACSVVRSASCGAEGGCWQGRVISQSLPRSLQRRVRETGKGRRRR